MTEAGWREGADLSTLIELLWLGDHLSTRKLRLFAVACCDAISPFLHKDSCRSGVRVLERQADGEASPAETATSLALANSTCWGEDCCDYRVSWVLESVLADPPDCTWLGDIFSTMPQYSSPDEPKEAYPTSCEAVLRDIAGNPDRPAPPLTPEVLTWGNETVVRMARSIYHGRAFEGLPVLADALEDAGCADAVLLSHLRSPGPHVRGCWALDLLLGKT